MGIVFLVTAVIVTPDLGDFVAGFVPRVPSGSLLTVVALIGTTVVPYNLFLHASSVQDKWSEEVPTDQAVQEARLDTRLSIGLGGLVTLAILTTAAAALFGTGRGVESAADMASQLEPLLGPSAKYFFAFGLLAAGITSSVTAPLAAAYATAGAFGWKRDLRDPKFKMLWAMIIVVGTTFAIMGSSPTQADRVRPGCQRPDPADHRGVPARGDEPARPARRPREHQGGQRRRRHRGPRSPSDSARARWPARSASSDPAGPARRPDALSTAGGSARGAWCVVRGAWCVVRGAWCVVRGAWCVTV